MTKPQIEMLRLFAKGYEAADIMLECSGGSRVNGGLAWRNADRTMGALIRRGYVAADPETGDWAITQAGRGWLKMLDAGPV